MLFYKFGLGFINIHPSLLPRYRGAAPVQWALINGDKETGVSISKVTPRLDDGDIILQKIIKIGENENAIELGQRLSEIGGELAVQAIKMLQRGKSDFEVQDRDKIVWAKALRKEDGKLDWNLPPKQLHDRIRGVQPWPGAFTYLGGKVFKIHRAAIDTTGNKYSSGTKPGQVVQAGGGNLVVATNAGFLNLLEVQLEGKRRMNVKIFLAGQKLTKLTVLGEVAANASQ